MSSVHSYSNRCLEKILIKVFLIIQVKYNYKLLMWKAKKWKLRWDITGKCVISIIVKILIWKF